MTSLPLPKDGFQFHPHTFCGKPAVLIIPKNDAKWRPDTLPFRSVIINPQTQEILSCGYPKFFNLGEKPELYPHPSSYTDWELQTKVDGSLVICDWHNNQFSMRTRGCASYKSQKNFAEFETLPQKYPEILTYLQENQHISLLFEMETPTNIIVVQQTQIRFTLLDAINKKTFQLLPKHLLHEKFPYLPKPETHTTLNLENLQKDVEQWIGKEGVVLSYNKNQTRIKLKSLWYRKIHTLKSQLNQPKHLINFYIEKNLPDPHTLHKLLCEETDFETSEELKPLQEKICGAGDKTNLLISTLRKFASEIKNLPRKEQAHAILHNKKEHASLLFELLEDPKNTPIPQKHLQRLLEAFLA